jgi:hypothetical protein
MEGSTTTLTNNEKCKHSRNLVKRKYKAEITANSISNNQEEMVYISPTYTSIWISKGVERHVEPTTFSMPDSKIMNMEHVGSSSNVERLPCFQPNNECLATNCMAKMNSATTFVTKGDDIDRSKNCESNAIQGMYIYIYDIICVLCFKLFKPNQNAK